MKQDEMTICECIEYLDSMVGDDKDVKDCLDYIERKAKSMDKRLREYKSLFEEEHPLDGNSFNFLNFKMYSNYTCGECVKRVSEWLNQQYKKPVYKLSQFEFDLIQTYRDGNTDCKLSARRILRELKDKGYFKCVDYDTKIQDILANCEVIK